MTCSSHNQLYRVGRLSWLSTEPTELFYITFTGKLGIFSGSCAAWATGDQIFLQAIRELSWTEYAGLFSFETQHGRASVQFLTNWLCFADVYPSFVDPSHSIATATFNRRLNKVGVRQEPSRKVLGYARLLGGSGTLWRYGFCFSHLDLVNEAIAFIPSDKGDAIWSRVLVHSPKLEEALDFVQLASDASVSGAAGSPFASSQGLSLRSGGSHHSEDANQSTLAVVSDIDRDLHSLKAVYHGIRQTPHSDENDGYGAADVVDAATMKTSALVQSSTTRQLSAQCEKPRKTQLSLQTFRTDIRYQCSPDGNGLYHCPREFNCNNHQATKRKGEFWKMLDSHLKPFRCSKLGCGKVYNRLSSLKDHLNSMDHAL